MNKNKSAFIIIGAAGFIGSAFSTHLKKNHHEVYDVLRGQISGIESDFHFIAELLKNESKHFVVVDFAYTSVPNTSFADPVKDYSENLYNVIRHLEFVKQLSKATYIYISSGGTVYGNPEEYLPITESHSNIPLSPYGITKLACEKYVLMYKEVYKLDIKIVRPSNIYGPGQRPFRGQGFIATAIAKILRREPIQIFGDGMQVRDYLYIDDFCKVLCDVIKFGKNGAVYNTGSGIGFSINDILSKVENSINVKASLEFLPSRPFDVRYNVLDSSLVSHLNNWHPSINLEHGLQMDVKWIEEYNAIN